MANRDIYLKIEAIPGYSPVEPDDHVSPPIQYRRDCMFNPGHEDGLIPADEVAARRLTALIYREYRDPQYLVPKPDKIVDADVNEPAFVRRVPGTVIYASPGDRLRIHVKNADIAPHSFHIHGVRYGIDSDGSWPFGTQSSDGRRSDEICPGQTWTYTYEVTNEMLGAWPFHDHCRDIGVYINRGLFGGLVVLPRREHAKLPHFAYPPGFEKRVQELLEQIRPHRPPMGDPPPGGMPPLPHNEPAAGMAGMVAVAPAGRLMRMDAGHGLNLDQLPPELVPYVVTLDEFAHAQQTSLRRDDVLHVPLFFHQMSGFRGTPVFQSAPFAAGGNYVSAPFTVLATYDYICGVHGPAMSGTVTVVAGGPSTANVNIVDFAFNPPNVTIGIGGQVRWTNSGPSLHSVVERGGVALPSYCFNGRTFVGNTPTVLARAGQRIRWYVFNLDLGMNWHNFHPHAQRWRFANETLDVRSIGPAESFIVDTIAPPVLMLTPDIEKIQRPANRPRNAKRYDLRGDFLFHCHVEMHMMQGLAALVRSHQSVWLTPKQANDLSATIGLALDPGDNACPVVDLDRCSTSMGGRWEDVPGLPGITFMHAVLLPKSSRLLFWGYGPRADQSRLWDQATGAYTQPANQPQSVRADQNIWSGAHAHINDAAGTILAHGGYFTGVTATANTERRSFFFTPGTSTWSNTANTGIGRFYPTTLTLADGKALTLYGSDNANGGGAVSSFEIFNPAAGGSWNVPKALPFNFFYYPWTFLLPGGDLFIAGPQKPARRFIHTASPIVDNPARQYNQISSARGVNMDGTAVLLPLKPPLYQARVLIAGGSAADAQQTAEWIDLSVAAPAWQALPNLNVPRDKVSSVLLPDGRVLIAGGIQTLADGGPAELFDPQDPASGFALGPNMKYVRGYHSAAILLPDGSVVMGGDPNGGSTPNERYLPPYCFKPRPAITAAPATIAYGAGFAVTTPTPGAIAEVVLMRSGAVTHGFNQDQRYVGCVITGRTAAAVNVTAPANGTIAPPGWYLLFLLDQDRTPSTATWVRLM